MGGQDRTDTTKDVKLRLLSVAALEKKLREGIAIEDLYRDVVRNFDAIIDVVSDAHADDTTLSAVGISIDDLKKSSLSILNLLVSNERADPYMTLCVSEDALPEEFRRRWKKLLQIFHPDRNLKASHGTEAKRINEAYDIIMEKTPGAGLPFRDSRMDIPPSYSYKMRQTSYFLRIVVLLGFIGLTGSLIYLLVIKDFMTSGSKFKHEPPGIATLQKEDPGKQERTDIASLKGNDTAVKYVKNQKKVSKKNKDNKGKHLSKKSRMEGLIDISEISNEDETSISKQQQPLLPGHGKSVSRKKDTLNPADDTENVQKAGKVASIKEGSAVKVLKRTGLSEKALVGELHPERNNRVVAEGKNKPVISAEDSLNVLSKTGRLDKVVVRKPPSEPVNEPIAGGENKFDLAYAEMAPDETEIESRLPGPNETKEPVDDEQALRYHEEISHGVYPEQKGEVLRSINNDVRRTRNDKQRVRVARSGQSRLDYDEAKAFIDEYVKLYEEGDVEKFLSLFNKDATENGVSISQLKRKYERIFRNAINRYKLSNLSVSIQKNGLAKIKGNYHIKRVVPGKGKVFKFKGAIEWLLRKENGNIEVLNLDYD